MMPALFEDRDLAAAISEKLKVYAQPQRLMILSCLARGERNVSEIGETTRIAQPALSQQLAELRRAELVSTRKEGTLVWYALADARVAVCVRTMEAMFAVSDALDGAPLTPPPAPRVAAPTAGPGEAAPVLAGAAGFARIL